MNSVPVPAEPLGAKAREPLKNVSGRSLRVIGLTIASGKSLSVSVLTVFLKKRGVTRVILVLSKPCQNNLIQTRSCVIPCT